MALPSRLRTLQRPWCAAWLLCWLACCIAEDAAPQQQAMDDAGTATLRGLAGTHHSPAPASHGTAATDHSSVATDHGTSDDEAFGSVGTEHDSDAGAGVAHGTDTAHGTDAAHDTDTAHGTDSAHGTDTGHAEDGHGDDHHDEEPPNAAVITMANVILFVVVVNMSLLYLLNFPVVEIRSSMYKILCTAMSVYCAVLTNQALDAFVFDQLISGKHIIGFGIKPIPLWLEITTSLIIFFIFLGTMNAIAAKLQVRDHVHVVLFFFAHLVAFAGINGFGNLQTSEGFQYGLGSIAGRLEHHSFTDDARVKYALSIVFGWVLISLLFVGTSMFRRAWLRTWKKNAPPGTASTETQHLMRGKSGGESMALDESAQQEIEPEEKLEEIDDAEAEASAIIVGFLINQTVILLLTNQAEPIHPHGPSHRSTTEKILMFCAGIFFLIMVQVVAFIKIRCSKKDKEKKKAAEEGEEKKKMEASCLRVGLTMATSMAWCLSTAGTWTFSYQTIAAAVLSLFALGSVILIQLIANRAPWRKQRLELAQQMQNDAQSGTQSQGPKRNKSETISALEEKNQVTDEALNNGITGFALLIGICWEKAFVAAEDIIVNELDWAKDHHVISKILLCGFLVGTVLPGWAMYILPPARRSWKEQFRVMNPQNS